jgi:hypothetical protein
LSRFVRPIAAVILPPLVQALWIEFLLDSPGVSSLPAAAVAPAYVLWVLSIPGCAAMWLFLGYRLIIRDCTDPRFDLAWFYFTIGMLVLIGISVVVMIYGRPA